jgi:3-oxoacyl-[acyl-carrier protein] reductase
MRLLNKKAIVTGGASGFGAGIVKKFLSEGAQVIIADRNEDAAQRYAHQLGDQAKALYVDVANGDAVQNMVEAACDFFGPIDIMVNNAGIAQAPKPMEEASEEEFDRLFQVNAKSIFLTARALVPIMKKNGGGTILNMASTAGVSPRPGLTWYNASKGWVITATRSMAVELAGHNIRVNALNPVAGDTPMLKTFMGEDTPQIRAKFLSSIPLGRFSTPEDLGNAACFLCSDEAAMITGVTMEVDGGRCI